MFNRFTSGTPHGNALTHLRNMFGYFTAATLLALFLGIGASIAPGSLIAGIFFGVVTAGIALVGGIFATMFMRSLFGLAQTGQFLQYAGFWLSSWLALKFTAAVSDGALTLTAPFVTALVLVAVAFAGAIYNGEVPKRSWLPVKKK